MTAADSHWSILHSGARSAAVDHFAAALRRPGAPQWVGQVNCGVLGPSDATVGTLRAPNHLARRCRNAARLLSLECARQDEALEPVRTGRLIRVVVETACGAAFCFPVVPDEHVVAFLITDGPVAPPGATVAADDVLIDLSTEMRDERGLPDLEPGGRRGPADPAVPVTDGPPTVRGRAASPLAVAAQRALDASSLQWIAHVRGSSIEFTADRFGDDRAAVHFKVLKPDERRRFYAEVASGMDALVGGLSRYVLPVIGGPARRLSLDVEQGVIVAQRLGAREYLVGVTLIQHRVAEVEDIVARLAAEHARP
jgi:hypothetical protein